MAHEKNYNDIDEESLSFLQGPEETEEVKNIFDSVDLNSNEDTEVVFKKLNEIMAELKTLSNENDT